MGKRDLAKFSLLERLPGVPAPCPCLPGRGGRVEKHRFSALPGTESLIAVGETGEGGGG